MPSILWFDHDRSAEHALVGGKGANLGLLTRAGFTVPPGFSVTTEAYAEFVSSTGIQEEVGRVLARLVGAEYAQIEAEGEYIRELFLKSPVPEALRAEITANHQKLAGDGKQVAVRSSGTAEDLADASFAGLHDTYLNVEGAEDLIDAVRRCWASMWTSRAIAYRVNHTIDQAEVKMAVVVQLMVDSEVSGVMFTGNPLTTATDEIVINASWGLGEAIVQGIVSPDQYTLKVGDLRIKERVTGTKALETVRDPATGKGSIERDVEAHRRGIPAMSDEQIQALGLLGRRVMEHYDGLPQDIEWGLSDGTLYLLQARPITGVDFSWDHDVDLWQPEDDDDEHVWTRVVADDMWTGAISPLMFSWRGKAWTIDVRWSAQEIMRHPTLGNLRALKYYKGEAYFNAEVDRIYMSYAPPPTRPELALKLPPTWRQEAIEKKFSYLEYVKVIGRAIATRPHSALPYGWVKTLESWIAERVPEAEGLPDEALRTLSDAGIQRYITKQCNFEHEYNLFIVWPGWFVWVRDALMALNYMVEKWYDGDNEYAYADLIAGSPKITATVREHIALYEISRLIRDTPGLLDEFNEQGADFFAALEQRSDTEELRERVQKFLEESGHRGHSDRDIYFPRYLDDPAVLYRALQAHVKSDVDPMVRERETNRKRDEVKEEVEANMRRKPLGGVKVEAFRTVLEYVLKFQQLRDDERHFIDRNTYSIRKAFLEINRRLMERGVFETDRDFWFLTSHELYALLDGAPMTKLTRAKIAARMRNFDKFNRKEVTLPKFLYRDRPFDPHDSTTSIGDDNVLRGVPTSRGSVTGTARIVKELSQIGRVNPGEILVVNSTDPGWTPVFALISGVVVETGGMLSHASCLSREYGFPAVQIEQALQLIPDGATISVNGDTGEVRIVDAEGTTPELAPSADEQLAPSADGQLVTAAP